MTEKYQSPTNFMVGKAQVLMLDHYE